MTDTLGWTESTVHWRTTRLRLSSEHRVRPGASMYGTGARADPARPGPGRDDRTQPGPAAGATVTVSDWGGPGGPGNLSTP
eukprot:286850-Hanusia_phi.AAC.1